MSIGGYNQETLSLHFGKSRAWTTWELFYRDVSSPSQSGSRGCKIAC